MKANVIINTLLSIIDGRMDDKHAGNSRREQLEQRKIGDLEQSLIYAI